MTAVSSSLIRFWVTSLLHTRAYIHAPLPYILAKTETTAAVAAAPGGQLSSGGADNGWATMDQAQLGVGGLDAVVAHHQDHSVVPISMPLVPGVPSTSADSQPKLWSDNLLQTEPSSSAGNKPKRMRSANWTLDEELTLIALFKDFEKKYETRKQLWEALSQALGEKQYERKPISLEQKWGNMLQTYRNIKEHDRVRSREGSFYNLDAADRRTLYHQWKVNSLEQSAFDAMDEFLKDRGVLPQHIRSQHVAPSTHTPHWRFTLHHRLSHQNLFHMLQLRPCAPWIVPSLSMIRPHCTLCQLTSPAPLRYPL